MNRPGDEANRPSEVSLPVIRASELAQYSFCRRAWWLTTVKQVPVQSGQHLRRGRQAHAQHERQVRAAVRWRYGGFWLMGAGGLFFIMALMSLWLGGG